MAIFISVSFVVIVIVLKWIFSAFSRLAELGKMTHGIWS